jgi:hypothetical protein
MNRKYDVDEKKATHLYCSHDITKNMSEFLEEVSACLLISIFATRLYLKSVNPST